MGIEWDPFVRAVAQEERDPDEDEADATGNGDHARGRGALDAEGRGEVDRGNMSHDGCDRADEGRDEQ